MKFAKLHPSMFVGLKAGIVDQEHYENMGKAIWLFLWCILRQTGQGQEGCICRGEILTYEGIHRETGFRLRNVRRWMGILVEEKYIRMEREQYGFKLWVANPRKFRVTTNGQSEQVEGGQFVPETASIVAIFGQSDDAYPLEVSASCEIPLRNYRQNTLKIDNTTAAAKPAAVSPLTLKSLAKSKAMPKTHLSEKQLLDRRQLLMDQLEKLQSKSKATA